MAFVLLDYFQKQGLQVVEASLKELEGTPLNNVTDSNRYKQLVVQPAWFQVALPIRMLGRKHLRWDEFYLALRDEVFDLRGKTLAFKPSMPARVAELTKRFFAKIDGAPVDLDSPMAYSENFGGTSTAEPSPSPAAPASHSALPQPASQPDVPSSAAGERDAADLAVGIDLGTTYSLVAYVDAQGRPCCILNAAGDRLTPSVVLFGEDGTIVGKEAVLASAMEPEKTAECVKRDMGAKAYRKQINGENIPPEVIASYILRSLKADAERQLGPIRKAVITVPAYFEETRRRATIDAGRLADLEVLDIINEPTAAAIAYGYQVGFLDRSCKVAGDNPLRVLVFDLGGGTFDVTIVEIKDKEFKALATDGDVSLGGKDWDEKLIDLAAERFQQQCQDDPRKNPVSRQELSLAAEVAKRTLTERRQAAIYINHLGTRMKVEVTRQEFEEATAALLERTRMTTEIVARQAGLTWRQIDRVLLVGGSTRMPMVGRMLQELTGKPADRSVSVDEAVAQGAALYAELLAPRQGAEAAPAQFSLTNVNSHSLGILGSEVKTGRKINKILIPKNSPLPRSVTKVFRTMKPNQQSVVIKVLEGESTRPEACTQVGVCTIRDLPPNLPAGWPVQVSYSYETNGRLQVRAKVKGQQAGLTTEFMHENKIPDEEIELWAQCIGEEIRKHS